MKIGLRIWILTIVLIFAFLSIINASAGYLLAGTIILLIAPFAITRPKHSVLKIIVIVVLAAALIAVFAFSHPKGVVIKSIETNSSAYEAGIRQSMIINSINGQKINSFEDYVSLVSSFEGGTEQKITIDTNKGEFIFLSDNAPLLTVSDVPRTRLKTGLDLSGGARAVVRPENLSLTQAELSDLIDVTSQRLNAFGISDVSVRPVTDLSGQSFMLVEIAGATPEDIKDLVGKQGKFEARIGNVTAFEGGSQDITSVCRNDATCSSVTGCYPAQGGYACSFSFAIYLSDDAAKRHAAITKDIPLDSGSGGRYLSENLTLLVDSIPLDTLLISSDLRGRETTAISIQGSGTGATQEEALANAKTEMHKLQTILISGSIPYKLEIVKLDTISPSLGKEFTDSLLKLGLIVFIAVGVVIYIRYRKVKITLAVLLTMLSEAAITLGIAALIRWNLDAPSIAGIIAGIGTGVNDQIVILDESSSDDKSSSVGQRIKRAFFIILGAFLTIVAAMIPLFWAGAGMLKGFALTTILGISIGILITRPAFAEIIRRINSN